MINPTDLSYAANVPASNKITDLREIAKSSIFSKSVSIPSTAHNAANDHNPFNNRMPSRKDIIVPPKINLDARATERILNDPGGLKPGYFQAVNEVALALQSQFDSNELTSGFPVRELYRLFIDRKDWQSEPVFFCI